RRVSRQITSAFDEQDFAFTNIIDISRPILVEFAKFDDRVYGHLFYEYLTHLDCLLDLRYFVALEMSTVCKPVPIRHQQKQIRQEAVELGKQERDANGQCDDDRRQLVHGELDRNKHGNQASEKDRGLYQYPLEGRRSFQSHGRFCIRDEFNEPPPLIVI